MFKTTPSKRGSGPAWWALKASLVVLAFQNCSAPLEEEFEEDTSLSSAGEPEVYEEPFAYDIQFDHIAYMSCQGMPQIANNRAFFTVRAGAYEPRTSGLQLRPSFLDQFSREFENDRLDPLQAIRSSIQNSTLNLAAKAQLSIRNRGNLQVPMISTGGAPQQAVDIDTFTASLDSLVILQSVFRLPAGDRNQFFNQSGGLDGRLLEATLRFNETNINESLIREQLANSSQLALTYSNGVGNASSIALAREQYSESAVFGRGYRFAFTRGHGVSQGVGQTIPRYTSGDRRVIASLSEVDLETGTTRGQWSCPEELKFVIVDPEDIGLGRVNCVRQPDPADPSSSLSTQDQRTLKAIRRVLRVEDWYVNLSQRCVVSKHVETSCYGSNKANLSINYLQPDPQDSSLNPVCGGSTGTECPHYVSLCTRTSD